MTLLPRIGLAAIAIALTGCATTSIEPRTMELEPQTKSFTFVKTLPNGNTIGGRDVGEALAAAILEESGLQEAKPRYKSEYADEVKGLRLEPDHDSVKIAYRNGEKRTKSGKFISTQQWATYLFNLEDKGDKVSVRVTTPNKVELKPNGIFDDFQPLLTDAEVKQNIEKINANLNPELQVSKTYKGEINTTYGDESVFANFDRILGEYESNRYWEEQDEITKDDIEKGRVFDLIDGRQQKPVLISVFPYRDGSKVLYSFTLESTVHSDGTVTHPEEQADAYIQKLENIVND